MAILFAANELEAFKISSTTDITGVTDAAELDTSVARAGMRSQQRATAIVDFTGQSAGWAHFTISHDDPDGSHTFYMKLVDTATGDDGVFRMVGGFNNAQVQMLSGSPSTWGASPSGQGSTIDHQFSNVSQTQQWNYSGIFPHSGVLTFDVNWDMQASGFARWYINGVLVTEFTGDTTPISNTQIDQLILQNGELTNDGMTISEVIVATEDTRGMRVVTIDPTGDGGTNTAWTGSVTDIDETTLSDIDLISSNTTGQIEQFTGGNLPTDGWDILAFVVGFRGQDDVSGVQQVRASLRSGTTDYNGATQAMPAAFEGFYEVWETDPDTAAAWTAAGIDAVEYGVESIT